VKATEVKKGSFESCVWGGRGGGGGGSLGGRCRRSGNSNCE